MCVYQITVPVLAVLVGLVEEDVVVVLVTIMIAPVTDKLKVTPAWVESE